MSVVVVGGNECVVRQYKELCMVRSALKQTKGKPVRAVRSHTSSINALRGILEGHMAESGEGMYV